MFGPRALVTLDERFSEDLTRFRDHFSSPAERTALLARGDRLAAALLDRMRAVADMKAVDVTGPEEVTFTYLDVCHVWRVQVFRPRQGDRYGHHWAIGFNRAQTDVSFPSEKVVYRMGTQDASVLSASRWLENHLKGSYPTSVEEVAKKREWQARQGEAETAMTIYRRSVPALSVAAKLEAGFQVQLEVPDPDTLDKILAFAASL